MGADRKNLFPRDAESHAGPAASHRPGSGRHAHDPARERPKRARSGSRNEPDRAGLTGSSGQAIDTWARVGSVGVGEPPAGSSVKPSPSAPPNPSTSRVAVDAPAASTPAPVA
jgi:hypothetical protein